MSNTPAKQAVYYQKAYRYKSIEAFILGFEQSGYNGNNTVVNTKSSNILTYPEDRPDFLTMS